MLTFKNNEYFISQLYIFIWYNLHKIKIIHKQIKLYRLVDNQAGSTLIRQKYRGPKLAVKFGSTNWPRWQYGLMVENQKTSRNISAIYDMSTTVILAPEVCCTSLIAEYTTASPCAGDRVSTQYTRQPPWVLRASNEWLQNGRYN